MRWKWRMWFLCPTKRGTGEFLREGEKEKEGDQRRLSKYYQLPGVGKHFFLFFFLNYQLPTEFDWPTFCFVRSKVLTLHGEFSCLLFILSAISYFFVAIFHFYLQYFTYISCLYWLRLNSKLWQSLPKVKRYWKTSGARISLDGGGGGEGRRGQKYNFETQSFVFELFH